MKIYVQSSGYSPDFGYCWMPELPPYLSKVSSYIQNDSPSLVLARFGKDLFLLVTDLSSPEKKDFRDRPIRHSVAWICENEEILRAIAVEALQGVLSSKVDELVDLDRKTGFTFREDAFKELANSILRKGAIENSPLDESEITCKIAKNSQNFKDDLAFKLQHFNLPSNYDLLVVVTGIKSEDSLAQANIWRSLSSLVKSDKNNWKTVSDAKKVGILPKKLMVAITLILLILIIGVIIFLVVLPK